jgi:hypothetical protein
MPTSLDSMLLKLQNLDIISWHGHGFSINRYDSFYPSCQQYVDNVYTFYAQYVHVVERHTASAEHLKYWTQKRLKIQILCHVYVIGYSQQPQTIINSQSHSFLDRYKP